MISLRDRVIAVGVAVVTAAALVAPTAAATPGHHQHRGWQAAWTAAQHHPFAGFGPTNWSTTGFADQSVRQVVRVTTGGSLVRVRLSNRFGTEPLRVTGATVARSAGGATLARGSVRPLVFGWSLSVVIPPGREVLSNPAFLPTRALDSVSVTLHFAQPSGPTTMHEGSVATTYRAEGDHRFDTRGRAFTETSQAWYLLAGVDTAGRQRHGGVVVAFGDSITDGYGTTVDANNRYPDQLAEQLSVGRRPVGVVNAGINGNKLLADSPCFGPSGVHRFERDVLDQRGVTAVVMLIGVNDIGGGGFPDFGCGSSPEVSAEQLIDAQRALIRAAHAEGVRVVGATMLPFKGFTGFDTPEKESVRDQVNEWIRTSGEFDAVADTERALADPDDPDALNPAYDSGDRLHPNDRGADVLAEVVAAALGR